MPPSSRRSSTTTMFSPSWAIARAARPRALVVSVPRATCSSALLANAWKPSFFETGSVSQPTPTIGRRVAALLDEHDPSVVARSARLPAAAIPRSRSSVRAASMSPSVSCSARLHSIIPAPVWSRSSLTRLALISVTPVPRSPRTTGSASAGRLAASGSGSAATASPAPRPSSAGAAAARGAASSASVTFDSAAAMPSAIARITSEHERIASSFPGRRRSPRPDRSSCRRARSRAGRDAAPREPRAAPCAGRR